MHGVEALGLLPGQAQTLGGDDPQARFLQHGGDLAGEVPAGGVGLDDRKSSFDGHGGVAPRLLLLRPR